MFQNYTRCGTLSQIDHNVTPHCRVTDTLPSLKNYRLSTLGYKVDTLIDLYEYTILIDFDAMKKIQLKVVKRFEKMTDRLDREPAVDGLEDKVNTFEQWRTLYCDYYEVLVQRQKLLINGMDQVVALVNTIT